MNDPLLLLKKINRYNFTAYFPRVSLENYHRTFTCAQRKIVMISAILTAQRKLRDLFNPRNCFSKGVLKTLPNIYD